MAISQAWRPSMWLAGCNQQLGCGMPVSCSASLASRETSALWQYYNVKINVNSCISPENVA